MAAPPLQFFIQVPAHYDKIVLSISIFIFYYRGVSEKLIYIFGYVKKTSKTTKMNDLTIIASILGGSMILGKFVSDYIHSENPRFLEAYGGC
jgi:hypothetical protein